MSLQKSLFKNSLTLISLLAITACASAIETPNQEVKVITPGASYSICEISVGNAVYQVSPPQKITVLKTKNPMIINCAAPGNRNASAVVESKVSEYGYGNILNGGIGAIYDFGTGALFKYPEEVFVDFYGEQPKENLLPSYHSPDAVPNGYDVGIESMGPDNYETKTTYERSKRMALTNEIEARKLEVEYGGKGGKSTQKSPAPAPMPYFPEPSFPGTTSF